MFWLEDFSILTDWKLKIGNSELETEIETENWKL